MNREEPNQSILTRILKKSCLFVLMLLVLLGISSFAPMRILADTKEITLSVKNGDDITDELQKSVKQYNKVIIPKGKYYCSGVKLNGLKDVTIYAEGATIVQKGSTNPIIYVSTGSKASNITIQGGIWDANKQNLPAIRICGDTDNIHLEKLTVTNSKNYAVRFENTENIKISNGSFTKSKCGIYFSGCTGDVIVAAAECFDNTDAGISAQDCSNVTLNDSELNNNGEGLHLSGITEKVSLSRNNMKNNIGMGIRILDCTGDVSYSKNYSYDNGTTGISMENCIGVNSLYRVNAKRNADSGIVIKNCTSIRINKCNVSSNGDVGIDMSKSAKITVQETTSEKNKGEGVYALDCEAVTLKNLTSQKNKKDGTTIKDADTVNVSNCTMYSNTNSGLYINGCGAVWLTYGAFGNNGSAGVHFEIVDKISVKGSIFYENTGYGFNLETLTTSGLLKNIESYKNGNMGLRYENCQGKINTQYSKVYNNAESGIYGINCENMVVNGSEVYDNKVFGVNAEKCALANVKYCNVHNNQDSGIRYTECRKVLVTDCDSNYNMKAGVYAGDCTTITFNLVEVKKNKEFGINVNNGTAVSTVDSIAKENNDSGFRYNGCKRVKITGCTADSNTNAGIYAASVSGYVSVSDSKITNTTGYGLNFNSVTGKNNEITKVSSSNNTNSGYLFTNSKGVVLKNSDSRKNGAHGVYVSSSEVTLNHMLVTESYWCGLSATGENTTVKINYGEYINNGRRPDQYENDDLLCAGIGIYGGAEAVITEAVCNGNHGCGITTAGAEDGSFITEISVYGCTVNNNKDHGIGARPYGKINIGASSSGKENIIKNNKHSGLMLNDHCTSDYVKDCAITGNGKAGISIGEYSKVKVIQNNTVKKNTEDGIHVSDNSSADIKNCISEDNKLSGIGVYSSSSVSVSDNCEIRNNEHYGICIDTSKATTIKECEISGNLWTGVVVRNTGEILLLNNCNISDSGTYGVYCSKGGKLIADGISVSGCADDGVRITGSGSSASISNVTITDCKKNGLVVTECAVLNNLCNITVKGNKKHGIAIYDTAAVNTVTGEISAVDNGENQIYVHSGADTDLTTQKNNYQILGKDI